MANILEFRAAAPSATAPLLADHCGDGVTTAEIVLFPGVRYERAECKKSEQATSRRWHDHVEFEE